MTRDSGVTTLMLPSNATSIRADISEGFSCENRDYGYYADVANECQIFHVCLPVMFNQRKSRTYQWSFICPEETVFSQDCFTCMRAEDMAIRCDESEKFYNLNSNFGGMMMDADDMGQFREVTSTMRSETTTFQTTTVSADDPMTTEEEFSTEYDMKVDQKTEVITQEVATEATPESEPPESVMQESENVIKTIENIVEKAARDLERVNATTPLTRTKRKGQRRRFLFAADA